MRPTTALPPPSDGARGSRPPGRGTQPPGHPAAGAGHSAAGAPSRRGGALSPRDGASSTVVRVNRPAQRLIIIVIALVLVIPIGALGLNQLMGPRTEEPDPSAEEQPEDNRPTVDPAVQPQRPEISRPEEPAALTEQSAEGAQATLTYMLESYTYMMTTGDTSVWSESVDPDCQVCVSFLDNAEVLNEQGGYLVDGEFEVEETSFEGEGEPPATGTVDADFTQAASMLVDDPTLLPHELDAVSGQLQAPMTWDGERWRVTDMNLVLDEASEGDGAGGEGDAGAGAGDAGAGAGDEGNAGAGGAGGGAGADAGDEAQGN